jgi:large conductance mechanosensitive channel
MAEKKSSRVAAARAKASAAKSRASTATKGHGGGFLEFIRTQGVVGLAVGLAIGTAAGATVKALVEGFINPVVQFIVGSQEGLQTAVWHVELWGRKADFAWGGAVSSAITLVATALVIYWIVNIFKLDRLDKKKD